MKNVVILCVLLIPGVTISARSQDRLPFSFNGTPGLHILVYDTLSHRSEAYYTSLCAVVDTEMGVRHEPACLHVVFVDQETSDRIVAANPGRFQGKDFTGAFLPPGLIILVGDEESDDTFMHEYLHYLETSGLAFHGVPREHMHRRIEETAGYLLASRSYLTFLRTQAR